VILDGGLATELENRGFDLNHHLWSARLLDSNPEAIADVHRSYLRAGADCLLTASYQGSIPGFQAAGYSRNAAISLLKKSVKIACVVRDEWIQKKRSDRIPPIVAASNGPYGAYLADGSEYHGQYKVSTDELVEFHEERCDILAHTSADMLAWETIPSHLEAEVICKLLTKFPDKHFSISFSCQNENQIYDGTPIKDVISLFTDNPRVIALGVNCTAPQHILGLMKNIKAIQTNQELIVYPNSGESYEAKTKSWTGEANPIDFAELAEKWFNNGARIIGGCCRTTPDHIRQLRNRIQMIASF